MNLPVEHLSDEAVAAFADGALADGARARAARHVAECAECAHAVAVQREAVWALRAAPAPALPGDLLERLRAVGPFRPRRR
jgi:anti-sigma factor RsiW